MKKIYKVSCGEMYKYDDIWSFDFHVANKPSREELIIFMEKILANYQFVSEQTGNTYECKRAKEHLQEFKENKIEAIIQELDLFEQEDLK